MDNETIYKYVKLFFLGLFIIFAVIGNISVLYAIQRYKKLKTVPNFFVFNLAIADLLFAVTGMPMIFVTTIAGKWILGHVMCEIVGLLNSLSCTTSIWTLVMISIHRYISVAKPQQVKQIYTEKRTRYLIACIWLFSFLVAMPPLFGWSQFVPGTNFCLIDGKKQISYSIFLLLSDYFFPFIFLTCLYFKIFILLKKHEKAMNKSKPVAIDLECESSMTIDEKPKIGDQIFPETPITNGVTGLGDTQYSDIFTVEGQLQKSPEVIRKVSLSSNSEYEVNKVSSPNRLISKNRSNTKKRKRVLKKEVKVTKMLLIVILGFFLCWTPFLVASSLYAFKEAPSGFHLVTFGIMTACLNSVINPIIYALMNNNFRFAFKSMYVGVKLSFHHLIGYSGKK